MDRLSLIVLALHVAIIVFAFLGTILTAVNFGLNREDFGIKTVDTLEKPVLHEIPANSSNGQRWELTRNNDLKIDDYKSHLDNAANYSHDPTVYGLVPFLITLVVTSFFLVMKKFCNDVFKSTAVLNSTIMLWFVHVYYFLSFLNKGYMPGQMRGFWKACFAGTVSLHCIMLMLLIGWIISCGRYLRVSEVKWPRCNCLKIFTLDFCITCTRFVLSGLSAGVFESYNGYGKYNHECIIRSCGRIRSSPALHFSTLSFLLLNVVISGEYFLSLMWGQIHRVNSIIGALISGISCLIIYYSSVLAMNSDLNDLGYSFAIVTVIFHLFHAWNIWANWNFISTPPNILQLVCGRQKHKVSVGVEENEGDISGNYEASANESDNVDESTDNSTSNDINSKTTSTAVDRSRCLLINIFVIILCLAGVIVEGLSFDLVVDNNRHHIYHMEVLLMAVLSSCLIKSITAVVTVIIYESPPPKSIMQVILEMFCESIVLLIGIAGSYHVPGNIYPKIAASLAICVWLLKIFDVIKNSPVQRIIELVASKSSNENLSSRSNGDNYQQPSADSNVPENNTVSCSSSEVSPVVENTDDKIMNKRNSDLFNSENLLNV